jgi:ribonuclease G
MIREILISSDHLEDRVALLEDGEIAEIFIARGERMVGGIYKGKVANVLPGMQAAFVDIGLEKNTFLCLDDALPSYLHEEIAEDSKRRPHVSSIEKILKPKQEILVQIVKEPIGTKGARVTTNLTLPGRYLVLLPMGKGDVGVSRKVENPEERERLRELVARIKPDNMGVIVRTAAEMKEEAALKQDLDSLLSLWEEIQKKAKKAKSPALIHQDLGLIDRAMRDLLHEDVQKILVDSKPVFEKVTTLVNQIYPKLESKIYLYQGSIPLFEQYGVESAIEKLLRKKVWLPSGGFLVIEQTEALTVIDVNTGKFVGSSHSLDDTILETNLEAAQEIARQIRVRDLSGIIIADFIDMERREDRQKLLEKLEEHLKKDRIRTTVFGITNLGLVEMTRKRSGKNLEQILREECFYCGGSGKVQTPETVAIKLERELRRQASSKKEQAVHVLAHPQVALRLAGWEGEHIAFLEDAYGKEIYLRVDPNLHIEKFYLHWGDPQELKAKIFFLQAGETLEVSVKEVHPLNFQNGVAFINGKILEIQNAGNLVGEMVRVRIIAVSHSYAMAQKDDA